MRSRIAAFVLGASFSLVPITMARADVYGAVTGVVVNQASNAILGASVVLKAEDSSHIWIARLPSDLAPGTYAVSVEATGEYGQPLSGRLALEVTG